MSYIRHLAPACGDYPLGQVPYRNCVVVSKIDTDFLQCFSHCCDSIIVVLWIPLPSRQRDMAVPLVAYPCRPFDEEYLRVTVLHPVLLEEGMQYVLKAELLTRI